MTSSRYRSLGASNPRARLILLVGLGTVGSLVLDLLLRLPGSHRFLVGGRDPGRARERTNVALFAANQLGCYPTVDCVRIDLTDVDQTAELLARWQPDLVFCAASLLPWGAIQELPPGMATRLRAAQIGPWLPVHLSPVRKLMLAVRKAAIPARVVNATYPDLVNPVLARAGLAPTTGIGDLANNIPALRHAAAVALGSSVDGIDVRLVAQHHVSYWMSRKGHTNGAPFHLSVFAAGKDVTSRLDVAALLRSLSDQYRRAPGNLMTAASATVVVDGLINDTALVTHAPGPNGMPGGYPVLVSEAGVSHALPGSLSIDAAVEMNTRAQRWDGIDRIGDDGTVYFAAEQMAVMREILGYECSRLRLDDADDWAAELLARHRERSGGAL